MKLKKVLHLSTDAAFGVELATERGTYQFMEVSPCSIEWYVNKVYQDIRSIGSDFRSGY